MRRPTGGVTLVELLLAIGLLTVVVAIVFTTFPSLGALHRTSWELRKAQVLAADKMEELAASPEDRLPGEEQRSDLPSCVRAWKVEKFDHLTSKLTVSVTWMGRAGAKKEVSFETLVLP